MEQNTTSDRLHSLDGIRGFAIILVILNHLTNTFVSPYLPPFVSLLLFGSGTVGVSLLFLLSGFLMAFIYPHPKSPMQFLQKRYTRIFPLFLTMCSVMLIYRVAHPPWYIMFPVTIILAYIAHTIWVRGAKPHFSDRTKRIMFASFLALQALVGAFYVFWIMRQAPIVFNQQVPAAFRETMIGLVNGTLTLPLGNYIPMLDGVYWSLTGEVLFYILYPILCVPIIWYLVPRKRVVKILFLLTLIPLFIGIDILSHQSLLLSLLQISYCFYFVTGMALGYLYRHKTDMFQKLHDFVPVPGFTTSIFFFALILIIKPILEMYVPNVFHPAINIIWAFPITFLIACALDPQTNITRIFRSKALIFLGTISYSLYLSHSLVINLIEHTLPITNVWQNLLSIALVFTIAILLSMLLYRLLEKPYFQRDRSKREEVHTMQNRWISVARNPKVLLSGLGLLYIVAILMGYQSNFNVLSLQYPFPPSAFTTPKVTGASLSMDTYPTILLEVTPRIENFKAITMHLTRMVKKSIISQHQVLIFHMKEKGQQNWLVTNTYKIGEIGNSLNHPFGFPIIPDATHHTYVVELSMQTPGDSEYIQIDTSDSATKGVYQVTKPELIHNPALGISILKQRVANILGSAQASNALLFIVPFILITGFLFMKRIDK